MFDSANPQSALLFAYGITNAGKSHTIMGTEKEPGIVPRTMKDIFSKMTPKLELHMSYLEIYNEQGKKKRQTSVFLCAPRLPPPSPLLTSLSTLARSLRPPCYCRGPEKGEGRSEAPGSEAPGQQGHDRGQGSVEAQGPRHQRRTEARRHRQEEQASHRYEPERCQLKESLGLPAGVGSQERQGREERHVLDR